MNFSSVSASASASASSPSSSSPPCHSQFNTISPTRVSYSSSPNSLDSHSEEKEEKRDKLLQAETTSGKEGTISSSPSQDSLPESETTHNQTETTRRNEGSNNKLLSVMEIMDEQDMGKHLLGLAIPMGVALVLSASSIVRTTEMNIVPISLSFAVACICNGLLLRKTVTNMSTFMLLLGYSLMMLSFYSLVGLFLPLYLKWIPLLCWLASLIPFAMYSWAYFRGDVRHDENDPEQGE